MEQLTAYGHSWVAGEGASSPSRGFVGLVAASLGLMPNNLGVGGSSTPATAALVERTRPPASAIYLVMTGLNDARLQGALESGLEEYTAALGSILAALALANPAAAGTYAVAQPPLLDYSLHAPHNLGADEIVDAYNERLRAVAADHRGVVLVRVAGWDAATMLVDDAVHPNDSGHAQLAAAVVQVATARPR